MRHVKDNSEHNVVIDSKAVSIQSLKKAAHRAALRFWCSVLTIVLVGSTLFPYLAMAVVIADEESNVFKGSVVPGYSMGGMEIAAYGVDINDWGQNSTDCFIKTDYGAWSHNRASNGSANLTANGSGFVQLSGKESQDYALTVSDKSKGWQAVTGKTSYTFWSSDILTGRQTRCAFCA